MKSVISVLTMGSTVTQPYSLLLSAICHMTGTRDTLVIVTVRCELAPIHVGLKNSLPSGTSHES